MGDGWSGTFLRGYGIAWRVGQASRMLCQNQILHRLATALAVRHSSRSGSHEKHRPHGMDVGEAFNKPADPKKHVPKCPKEKELAIIDALKAFRMLEDTVEYREEAADE